MNLQLQLRFIDVLARRGWPLLRPFLRKHLDRRCDLCLLPEARVAIEKDGVCRECRVTSTRPAAKRNGLSAEPLAKFDALIRSFAGKGQAGYDALFSGGKKSTYLLHHLTFLRCWSTMAS
jgi:hypothetical protein